MPVDNVKLGKNVKILYPELVNLYACQIGDDTYIGPFVEIQRNVIVGNKCKVSTHSFLCEGVTLEDEVFIGHGVMFTNDLFPRSTQNGQVIAQKPSEVVPTLIKKGASIGSGSVILCGITIGEKALVGAGAVVTKSVEAGTIVAGNPAKVMGKVGDPS